MEVTKAVAEMDQMNLHHIVRHRISQGVRLECFNVQWKVCVSATNWSVMEPFTANKI